MTSEDVLSILKSIPPDKAPGPDGLTNRVLKNCAGAIAPTLARLATDIFHTGHHPHIFKTTTTVVLRKPQKGDYTLPSAYRPIALENTLAKIVEKIAATRLTEAAEKHNMLPPTQMGARPGRSTATALSLLVEQTHAAWAANPRQIVSVLSLDLSGAFDRVSHERLLEKLRLARVPEWMVLFLQSFLTRRTTQITFDGFTSNPIEVPTGIPQGSPLSPVLFLFFASELLHTLNAPPTFGMGFVDDTYIIRHGQSAKENCKQLKLAHERCLTWARRHGASFAPDKYNLIHLTRRRGVNLSAMVHIPGVRGSPVPSLRILGVQVDSKLA